MAARVLARETLPDHGELRAYRLEGRAELLLEVFREADGRAWQLRLPLPERAAVARLLRQAVPSLADPDQLAFDASGTAMLGGTALGLDAELAVVVLAQGEDRAFALWRRERLRTGWSWTIDLVLVPMALGQRLCRFVQEALAADAEEGAAAAPASGWR
jgi:hypothetical protein